MKAKYRRTHYALYSVFTMPVVKIFNMFQFYT
nr:MAG TPA: hypothetical protein [Caudoviricetes sp.]